MIKYIQIIAVFLLLLPVTSQGQTRKKFLEAAETAYSSGNFYAALVYYNEVLAFDEKNVDIIFKSAEAARKFDSYAVAAEKYALLIDSLQNIPDSTALFYAGEMNQRLGKFDKATEYYDLYLSQFGNEKDYLSKRAKKEKASCAWAAINSKEPDETVSIERLGGSINSEYSDFGAIQWDTTIYFSSQRFVESKPVLKPARQLAKIISGTDNKVNPVNADFNRRELSVANSVFNTDKTKLFYTVCEFKADNELRCDLYWSKVNADGSFSEEQMVAAPINMAGYTTTQPSFAKDPINGNEVLYFVSDRPGGKGKLDLWMSVFDKRLGFSNPINLTDVNTAENDVTPFFHQDPRILYFSSEGKTGFGGYDIYYSQWVDGSFLDAVILPMPYNSTYHDIYYRPDETGETALFSSNREGASYVDELLKSCCYDIYKAQIDKIQIDLNALTFDKNTGEELNGATVTLLDHMKGKTLASQTPEKSHEHIFSLSKGITYLIIASKPGYKPDTITFSTHVFRKSEKLTKKLFLETDKLTLDLFTFDANDKKPLSAVKITIEDLTDPSNPMLVQMNEEGNNYTFQLEPNKTYRVTATKTGYGSVTENIETRGGSGKITRNLYLPRADINRLLPLALYFDNDEPDPDSKSTDTKKIFGELLQAYMHRKPEFMEKYGRGVKGAEKQESIDRMEAFFEGDVRGGYDRFSLFMDELIKALGEGQKIDMMIRGYASPRFDDRYNLVLGQRRINSVRNDMMKYRNGALAPYLINEQLIITEISYGEELSPVDVDDNINDEKGSIYSLKASKERKVEVISVKIK
ncbi:MAG: PD40 domain-containing protein [Saprospiraceae bacterium]|nr:PD40 domain-containing protein [Saprospiraceae bacterium]MBK9688156.1 PD40 domain-containing protein [Saprospiraceae bacterium]